MNLESLAGLGSKDLGARFNLVGSLPTMVLALLLVAGLASGAPGRRPEVDTLVAELRALDAVELALVGFAVLVVSVIVHPLQLALVRLLEGYWGGGTPGADLARWKIERHRRRRQELHRRTIIAPAASEDQDTGADREAVAAAAAWQLRRLYPAPDRLLPTRLGNTLRAAEDRAGDRYGLDAVLVWPRLVPVLSAPVAGALDDARNQLDVAARFTATFALAAMTAVVLFATHGWWLALAAVAAGLSWFSYLGATRAAIAYGELMETAFDLHRFDLLRALHIALPADHAHEVEANKQLTAFLRQDFPTTVDYDHD